MRPTWILLGLAVASCWSCAGGTKKEYAIPKSGGAACTCATVCACNLARDEEMQKEQDRCKEACQCDKCPYE